MCMTIDLHTVDDQVQTPHEDDSKTYTMPNDTPLLVVPHVKEEQNARLLEEECAYHIPTNTPCDDSIPTPAGLENSQPLVGNANRVFTMVRF